MKNTNYLTLFKLILLGIAITMITEVSHGQVLWKLGSSAVDKLKGKRGKMLVKKITAIELSYDKEEYVPLGGTAFGLKIEATLKNGKKVWTGNGTKNTITWENYAVEVEGGKFDPKTGLIKITGSDQVSIRAKLISSSTINNELIINPLEIKKISLSQKPGEKLGTFLVTAKAILSDNSTVDTQNGKLPWGKLDIAVQGAEFTNGELTLPGQDYRDIKDDNISLEAKVKGKEDISSSMNIPLEYTGEMTAYFGGGSGRNGQDGAKGASGINGKAGSGERAGGNGGHGQRGIDGGIGGDGTNAQNLEVYVGLTKNKVSDSDLLKVHVKSLSSGKESYLKIDPINGKLYIYANGGNGGDGGDGGDGGYGGSGGGGKVSGKTGNGGNGANGGTGGNGGNGGNVQVFVHPLAKKYISSIVIHNNRGNAGGGGSAGSGGGCSSGCDSRGESGKFGNVGKSGYTGKVIITKKEVVFNW